MTKVFKLSDKVTALKAKLELWRWRMNTETFNKFCTVAEIIEQTEVKHSFSQLEHDHLLQLPNEFKHYFPIKKDPKMANEWICNLFVKRPGQSKPFLLEDEKLVEIVNDGDLQTMFGTTSNLFAFWLKVKAEYPDIATKALKALLPFPTTYLSEAGFSVETATKTRLQNWLDIHNNSSVTLSHHS